MTKAQLRIEREYQRAARDGVTVQQVGPVDSSLSGYLRGLRAAKRLAA